jgi:hypothetical protein
MTSRLVVVVESTSQLIVNSLSISNFSYSLEFFFYKRSFKLSLKFEEKIFQSTIYKFCIRFFCIWRFSKKKHYE